MYKNTVLGNLGGETVSYTNPWRQHHYFNDVETREDGGIPTFLRTISIVFSVQLKENMRTNDIKNRENEANKFILKL